MKDFTSEGISFCDKKRKKDRLEISNFFLFVCMFEISGPDVYLYWG